MTSAAGHHQGIKSKRAIAAWCFFDWANSAFPTVIITFVFSAYVTKGVANSVVEGTAQWGYAMSFSAFLVAIAGPVFGAIADHTGARKPWLAILTAICIGSSVMLWGVQPDSAYLMLALGLVALGNFAFETSMVFYNAMMPGLAPPRYWGRLSGWGWGLGYAGGLCCLVIALVGFVQPEVPWFGLDKQNAENIRILGPVVGIWMAVFTLPLFLFVPDQPRLAKPFGLAISEGLQTLVETIKAVRKFRHIATYLLARMIYTDGLNTLFAFGGIFAAGTFGFSFEELIIFGIALNVTAGLGAAAFAVLDDRIGPKTVIMIALIALTALGGAMLVVESKSTFWALGLGLGIFIGPAQSASRSMMAHLSPHELRTEMFGLYALSGKATAFLGPAILGVATEIFASQRAGMGTILVFFIIGGLILISVPAVHGSKTDGQTPA